MSSLLRNPPKLSKHASKRFKQIAEHKQKKLLESLKKNPKR